MGAYLLCEPATADIRVLEITIRRLRSSQALKPIVEINDENGATRITVQKI